MKNRLQKIIKSLSNDDRGSAIILALIIIAALATTGIGAARLTKSNISQTTSFEDGLKAYYAAEAGVEAALLEWRFDHDVEFWNADKARLCYDAVKNDPENLDDENCELAKMTRMVNLQGKAGENPVDITSNKFDAEGNVTNEDYKGPTNQPWYELKIYYRDPKRPFIGDPNRPRNINDTSVKLEKDQTYEMRFASNDQVGRVLLYWYVPFSYNYPNEEVKLMWHPIGITSTGKEELIDDPTVTEESRKYYSDDLSNSIKKEFVLPVSGYYSEIKNIRIKSIIKTDDAYMLSGELKNVVLSAVSFDKSDNIIHIPSSEVNIEVVGHYNNTERKLSYKLSRESGTIMDIFDFGVFSQSSLRK